MKRYYTLTLFFCFATQINAELAKKPLYQENYNSCLAIGQYSFKTEMANTIKTREKGMMYRPSMLEKQAMVFIYSHPQPLAFWMKNTLIPLDMLFFNAEGLLQEIKANVPPCKTDNCPIYPAKHSDNQFVVELKSGTAKKLNLMTGIRLDACKN
ncbi:MAG: DUF192 domain-containing protein [Ostreibacterium sp.]